MSFPSTVFSKPPPPSLNILTYLLRGEVRGRWSQLKTSKCGRVCPGGSGESGWKAPPTQSDGSIWTSPSDMTRRFSLQWTGTSLAESLASCCSHWGHCDNCLRSTCSLIISPLRYQNLAKAVMLTNCRTMQQICALLGAQGRRLVPWLGVGRREWWKWS